MLGRMQGAIICGIAITTIISWIPGHAASYLGPNSNLPGKSAMHLLSHVTYCSHRAQSSPESSVLCPREMPGLPQHGSGDQDRQGQAFTGELYVLAPLLVKVLRLGRSQMHSRHDDKCCQHSDANCDLCLLVYRRHRK